jgi:Fe-S-cluster-containing dehydrogenase component
LDTNRRDFLRLIATASGVLVTGDALASADNSAFDANVSFGVLVDTVVCIGCRKCELACNEANSLPKQAKNSFEDKSVFNEHRRPTDGAYTVVNTFTDPVTPEKPYFMKIQCMHCIRPACVSACIVGALKKTPQGAVTYDTWKCMGCRYCMIACPFQIPAYEYGNALAPQVRKCSFCFERITKEGKKPACVEICPNEALTFGTRKELLELAHGKIKQGLNRYSDHVYGEHEIGGTSWMYLASIDFVNTELPRLASRPVPETTEAIQHGVFKSFVPPLALYGLLALAMHSFRNRGGNGGHDVR